MKFSIKGFFSKCDQISRKLRIWSHLLKKSFMENFIFYAMNKMNGMGLFKLVAWLISIALAIKMNKFTTPKQPQQLEL